MNPHVQQSLFVLFLFFSIVFIIFYILPLSFNYSLVKSRGRKNEMFLWMFLTLIGTWFITLILLVMKPVDVDDDSEDYVRAPLPPRYRKDSSGKKSS